MSIVEPVLKPEKGSLLDTPPLSTGSDQTSDANNAMMILMIIEKGELDSSQKLQKIFSRQRADGVWQMGFIKALMKSVSTGRQGPTSFKEVEDFFNKYLQEHPESHFDANQIIDLFSIEKLTKGIKNRDEIISLMAEKVAKDLSEVSGARKDVQNDSNRIQFCEDQLKSWKDIWPPYLTYWTGELTLAEISLSQDSQKLQAALAQLNADNDSLLSAKTEEKLFFSKAVNASLDKGEKMKDLGQVEEQQLENFNKETMNLAASFFVVQQQA